MAEQFDRTRDDLGNIVALEHVNVTVPDQRLAMLFYIIGMGFTRDPYMQVGDENMFVFGLTVEELDNLHTLLIKVHEKLIEFKKRTTSDSQL